MALLGTTWEALCSLLSPPPKKDEEGNFFLCFLGHTWRAQGLLQALPLGIPPGAFWGQKSAIYSYMQLYKYLTVGLIPLINVYIEMYLKINLCFLPLFQRCFNTAPFNLSTSIHQYPQIASDLPPCSLLLWQTPPPATLDTDLYQHIILPTYST